MKMKDIAHKLKLAALHVGNIPVQVKLGDLEDILQDITDKLDLAIEITLDLAKKEDK